MIGMLLFWPRNRNENKQPLRCNLKELRFKRHFTQSELASKLGVSRQTIIAIENERYYPSLLLAFKIAGFFDTTLEVLFSLAVEEKPVDEAYQLDQEIKELLRKEMPGIDW